MNVVPPGQHQETDLWRERVPSPYSEQVKNSADYLQIIPKSTLDQVIILQAWHSCHAYGCMPPGQHLQIGMEGKGHF